MISKEQARELFESKMRWVEQQTGRNVKLGLVMKCGPEDAETVYEQMFVCFLSGMETGMKQVDRQLALC
jgi:hypothetical protein